MSDTAKKITQFRKKGCADWYDGNPDWEIVGTTWEVRTLHVEPPKKEISQHKLHPHLPYCNYISNPIGSYGCICAVVNINDLAHEKWLRHKETLLWVPPAKNQDNGYGYCPHCNAIVISRERRPNGDDKCEKGHVFPSRLTLKVKG